MKNNHIAISKVILLMVFLIGCNPRPATPTPVIQNPIAVQTLRPTAEYSEMDTASTINYEILSPYQIRKDGVTFEASGRITLSTFHFIMNAWNTQLPSSYDHGNLVESVVFTFPDRGTVLDLEFFGGGGGKSYVNGNYVIDQEFRYRIKNPLSIGKNLAIQASVTFAPFTEIITPVDFQLFLVAENDDPQIGI